MRNRPKFIKHTNTIANPPALTNGAVRGCPSHRQNAWSPFHTFFQVRPASLVWVRATLLIRRQW
jgi:hypothetical protein